MKKNLLLTMLLAFAGWLSAGSLNAQPKYAVEQGVLTLNGSLGFTSQTQS